MEERSGSEARSAGDRQVRVREFALIDVWRLATESEGSLVLRTPLTYFHEHFVGHPMGEAWEPPEIAVRNPRRRLRDFTSWMLMAPVITPAAKVVLEPLIAPHVELLPLTVIRGQQLYAVNVLRQADCLDESRSHVLYSQERPGTLMNVLTFRLKKKRVPKAPIFKISTYPIDVFVTRGFVDAVRTARLTGAAFADPTVNPFPLLFQGKSINVVEGLAQ